MTSFDLPDSAHVAGTGILRLRLERAHALFAGHFPGDPVLPGIAHLGLALEAVRRRVADWDVVIVALDEVRFLRPVRPVEDIEVEVSERDASGSVRFGLRSAGQESSRGRLRVAGGSRAGRTLPLPSDLAPNTGPSPAELLPHGPEATLVTGVLARDADGITCRASVPRGSPFAEHGEAPAWLVVEMAAQAAGVHVALSQGDGPAPVAGFLARVREMTLLADALPAGADCRVSVRLLHRAVGFGSWDVRAELSGAPLAHGSLTTWLRG